MGILVFAGVGIALLLKGNRTEELHINHGRHYDEEDDYYDNNRRHR